MTFHLLHFKNRPITEHLKLEEDLLRNDTRNWCLINEGSERTIVMGISGKAHELADVEKCQRDSVPIIRRFSGGGTVIVDENTLFITFICRKDMHPFPAYPEPILRWTESFYPPHIRIKENDYVIGEKKCGGNAQYIKKDRWLHHTSFLWDFSPTNMDYLLYPKKTPQYRAGRAHTDFLCRLRDFFPSKEHFLESFKTELARRYGTVTATALLSDPSPKSAVTL